MLRSLWLAIALVAAMTLWNSPWAAAPKLLWTLSRMPPATQLPVPVDGVRPRQIADTFGAPRGRDRSHAGIDIFAKRGTPVLSATEGVVTRIGENTLGGQVVWVMGPGRQMHYYAHLDGYADIRRGQLVAPGDVLGFVGNTGNAKGTPPHLHYGIYAGGGALNPYPLLISPGGSPMPVSSQQ